MDLTDIGLGNEIEDLMSIVTELGITLFECDKGNIFYKVPYVSKKEWVTIYPFISNELNSKLKQIYDIGYEIIYCQNRQRM